MDAMDRQASAIRYHGCLIVELYNRGRPHSRLGPGVPDPPRGTAVVANPHPDIDWRRMPSYSRNPSWEGCIMSIPLKRRARAPDRSRRKGL